MMAHPSLLISRLTTKRGGGLGGGAHNMRDVPYNSGVTAGPIALPSAPQFFSPTPPCTRPRSRV